jgi:hypothetical protein
MVPFRTNTATSLYHSVAYDVEIDVEPNQVNHGNVDVLCFKDCNLRWQRKQQHNQPALIFIDISAATQKTGKNHELLPLSTYRSDVVIILI